MRMELSVSLSLLAVAVSGCDSGIPDLDAFQSDLPEYALVEGPDGYYLSRSDGDWGTQTTWSVLRFDSATLESSQPEWADPGADESAFYYSSARKLGCFTSTRHSSALQPDDDIWCVRWLDDHWDEAQRLPAPINTGAFEFSPVIRDNGDIFFASNRGDGYGNLYVATLSRDDWEVDMLGPEVNSSGGEWNLDISPDGELLIFESSHRKTNRTISGDLYVSRRTDNGWSDAIPIEFLNTDGSDLMARFVDDETIVYSTSVGPDVELRKASRSEIEALFKADLP